MMSSELLTLRKFRQGMKEKHKPHFHHLRTRPDFEKKGHKAPVPEIDHTIQKQCYKIPSQKTAWQKNTRMWKHLIPGHVICAEKSYLIL